MYLRYFEYYFSMRRTWSLNWIIYYFLQMYLRADKDVTKNVFDDRNDIIHRCPKQQKEIINQRCTNRYMKQ